MIFLNDIGQRITPPLLLSWERTEEINQPWGLSVRVSKSGLKKYDRILHEGKEYVIEEVAEEKSSRITVELFGRESLITLKDKIIWSKRPGTLHDALLEILAGTEWTIGTFPDVPGRLISFYRQDAYSCLMEVLNDYGLEMETAYTVGATSINRTLNLKNSIGQDIGRRTTYQTDMLSVKRTVAIDSVITRLYGSGMGEFQGASKLTIEEVNGGIPYIEDEAARTAYGIGASRRHREGHIDYPGVEDPNELLGLMQADLEKLSKPQVSYEANIVDLGLYDDKLGDTIIILDEDLDIAVSGRVLKRIVTRDKTFVTIGNILPTLLQDYQTIKAIEQKIFDLDTLRANLVRLNDNGYLQDVLDLINAKLNTTSGFASLIPGRGIIIPNAPTEEEATQIIELGGGFWRIANSKDQLGNWLYRTVADGNGIIGSEIVTGIIRGGNVFFNLDAGTFLIGDPLSPSFYWNGTSLYIDGSSIDLSANEYITSRITTEQLALALDPYASKAFVQTAIDQMQLAKPNLITNLPERWEQGDIVSGALVSSPNHIRTMAYYPIRTGPAAVKVGPLYEAKIVIYDQGYNYVSEVGFSTELLFSVAQNGFFKAVLRRANLGAILPEAMDVAELKVENNDSHTAFTPYWGDLSLEDQREDFSLELISDSGWTFESDGWVGNAVAILLLFNEDVTSRFDQSQFTWYRQFADAPREFLALGTSLTMLGSSYYKSATITCEFAALGTIYVLGTFTGDTLMTLANDEIVIIGDYE